ncbi:2-succinyl-5-enolpyruvyl-6-hydroxy-3-cyclohexene-1-carboxylic-acid synthase [Marinigracilibium pacificum]|uniref:2-succinyl-5-enolpyruvyl-6-hydroxy-3-cyclohexene-1-carboxylate synthase n=1 Tax=Marinigracilibium pacificum TaxID=2729599 RepID=A0A848J4L6_9BACT|nr:2-succinyl-5-enolpyruvyl-6-hydroxy-3-cyclohexene-1-carboxylic-acid synthase [Marinigracilibium pacificum]NMM48112.1 2-succinyl-5-enolpyruvyl-6-hydroxy-3-cyclohexene-1-carboxylic-acid synthase [Marinigracilibium pacificum]
MILEHINQIPVIAAAHGVTRAILSPGSRVAPLTLAFTRYKKINCYTLSDERSAAFTAMGMSEATNEPVVIACTSGTAASNYIPAVTEAYYKNIPLVILTADRPPEWIDQWDGQTIRQKDLYSNHIKRSFELPVDVSHPDAQWQVNRILNEAFIEAKKTPSGPVHINIPLREPFYPGTGETYHFQEESTHIIKPVESKSNIEKSILSELEKEYEKAEKILILAGQSDYDNTIYKHLSKWAADRNIPVIADIISNTFNCDTAITKGDIFLKNITEEEKQSLVPDLIISFGKSTISKNMKLFLRDNAIKSDHWHIGITDYISDPFKNLTRVIRADIESFISSTEEWEIKDRSYLKQWTEKEIEADHKIDSLKPNPEKPLNELVVTKEVITNLPDNSNLHLANSMPVRWANFISGKGKNIKIYANRGTSGIDGTISTASGHALANKKKFNLVLTGDLSFFYDRNALWHNYTNENFCIVMMNNHGGGIFGLIAGPSDQPEKEEWFETRQKLTAKNTASDFGFNYISCNNIEDLESALESIRNSKGNTIIEIFTDKDENKKVFQHLRK